MNLNKQHKYNVAQAVFWLLFLAFQISSDYKVVALNKNIISNVVYTVFICGLVYVNVKYLIPKLFFKQRYFQYLLSIFVTAFVVNYVHLKVEELIFDYSSLNESILLDDNFSISNFVYPFIEILVVVGAISSILIAFEQTKIREQLIRIEKENINTQLAMLKSQTNPHFLFNVLNSIHFLIHKSPDKASDTLLKLSDLLRYQLYETGTEFVLLQNEINHINNYIDLELMRIGDAVTFSSNLKSINTNVKVPSFLLLPLVENSFKHSANVVDRFINLQLTINEKELLFITKNTKGKPLESSSGGLGLKNLRQRLELLYPEKHTFSITETEDVFTTKLKIEL